MTIAEQSLHQADFGTLRNFVQNGRSGPVHDAMLRLIEGTETEDDRGSLLVFASTYHDTYPRTCEALSRVLDGGAA